MKSMQRPMLKRSSIYPSIATGKAIGIAAIFVLLLGIGAVVHAQPENSVADIERGEAAFITTATLTPSLTPEGTLTFTPTFTTSPSATPAATSTPQPTRTTPPTPTSAPSEASEATDEPTLSETATPATEEMIALSPIAAASATPTGEATSTPVPTATPAEGSTSDANSVDSASGTWFILAMVIVVVLAGLFFRANTSGQE